MLQRTSVVDLITINTVSFSSIVEIGDATYHQSASRALAVQRQKEFFYGSETEYEDYSVFTEPIPLLPIIENVTCHFENRKPIIKVNHINIIGISSASLLQVGNCRHLYAEARIKHIRQIEQPLAAETENNFIQLNEPSQFNTTTPESPISITGTNLIGTPFSNNTETSLE
ncbi:spore germination protein GerPE [Niallia circulans]|uniref:spore germination protein GerPE n=1 Tax=Niallia circulans TaxID=1397 RepID=UPI001560A975|nr:spore germination protein GerPE [Niallia circulans]NRG33052.1 spore germination protein GerPE [Niallia circulans]